MVARDADAVGSGLRPLGAWLLVAFCVALIFLFSGDDFSARETSRYTTRLLHWLFPGISGTTVMEIHHQARKLAHLTEYAVLGLLAYRALRLSLDVSTARIATLTLLLVLAVASADETRQANTPTRTGSVWDVALNLAGGTLGVVLIVAVHRILGVASPGARARPPAEQNS